MQKRTCGQCISRCPFFSKHKTARLLSQHINPARFFKVSKLWQNLKNNRKTHFRWFVGYTGTAKIPVFQSDAAMQQFRGSFARTDVWNPI
ncbi:hypothetical protein [Cognatiyoonia koreensis]|uniref:hypothetical protein n=1 Tax=Cognatiyoonia koreensis TaxID=364200 RepID=UPI0010425D14|nr:hypothetical protein [Cognatiyoonia koreensis]